MKHNNFFLLLGSRLGLKNYPIGSSEHNIGVEDGAQDIYKNLINSDNKFEKEFTRPEDVKSNFLEYLFKEYNSTITEIKKRWQLQSRLITIGGDHSISYISLNCVLQRHGKDKTGIIFFDSHTDLHLTKTSPTGNFHGMWMRTFFDQFKETELASQKLKGEQLLYIGNLSIESEEDRFIKENNIININQNKLDNAQDIINNFIKKFKHIHITFDIDVFDQSIVNATGTPNPKGLDEKSVFNLLDLLLKQESISIDIVEYNPKKDINKQTLEIIKKIVNKV